MEYRVPLLPKISLNIGQYTAIYNEYETIEEDILNTIDGYFKKRNSNKKEVSIIDTLHNEEVSNLLYESIIISNQFIENEHLLSSTSIMNKNLQRNFAENIEGSGYLQSINVLLEDLLELINNNNLPLKMKNFDIKQFIKLLSFEYHLKEDYTKLIVRIEQILPLLIEELNKQNASELLLIYLYPEANLSPKEQIRLKSLLIKLDITTIVLTGSMHFLSSKWQCNNYIRNDKQKLTNDFIERLEWYAPLNFHREDIEQSLNQFILNYHDNLEIKPTISNYKITQIMLFNPIDLYVGISYLQHCNHEYQIDINEETIPDTMSKYLKQFKKDNTKT